MEGPIQSWGNQESKFVIRRTAEAPTKSGVIGMLCAALGVSRPQAAEEWLPKLGALRMGVRIDVSGVRWWDYHTVGANMEMRIAAGEGKTKPGAMLTRREYLCDASFLVALQGEPSLIGELEAAMKDPKWTLYLGRKCCPPSRPFLEHPAGNFPDLLTAIKSVPWRKRLADDNLPESVDFLLDWFPTPDQAEAPEDAEIWYHVPLSFDPPAHQPRFVIRKSLRVGESSGVGIAEKPAQKHTPSPARPRADYGNSEYKKKRTERLERDQNMCIFCKTPIRGKGATVQHITYPACRGW